MSEMTTTGYRTKQKGVYRYLLLTIKFIVGILCLFEWLLLFFHYGIFDKFYNDLDILLGELPINESNGTDQWE